MPRDFIFALTIPYLFTYLFMKITKLAFMLLLCQAVAGQTLLVNTADKETGARTLITNNYKGAEITPDDSVARDGLVFFSAGYQETKAGSAMGQLYFIELNVVHKDNRLGCLEDGKSKVAFIFEDGSRIECIQISETNCDPVGFVAGFALMPKGGTLDTMKQNFSKLRVAEVARIEVFTSEKTMVYHIKSKAAVSIKSHFNLLNKTINPLH